MSLPQVEFCVIYLWEKGKSSKRALSKSTLILKNGKKTKPTLNYFDKQKKICCSVLELKINPWRESCQTQPFSSRYEWHVRSLSLCHFTSVRDGKPLRFVNVYEMQEQDSNWLDTVFGAAQTCTGWTAAAKWSDLCELRKLAAFKVPQTSRNYCSQLLYGQSRAKEHALKCD